MVRGEGPKETGQGKSRVSEEVVDQKETRNTKRSKKSPQKVVMVEDTTEVIETLKQENSTPPSGSQHDLVDEEVINEDTDKSRFNNEGPSSIRRSKRSRKRAREAPVLDENDVVVSPSVKKCRVMLRSMKEESGTEREVSIIQNEESNEKVDRSGSLKNVKTVDLASSEEIELSSSSGETSKTKSRKTDTVHHISKTK